MNALLSRVQNLQNDLVFPKLPPMFRSLFAWLILCSYVPLLLAKVPDKEAKPISMTFEYFYDATEKLSIDDIRSEATAWQKASTGQVNLGLVPGSLWAKIVPGPQRLPGETYLLQYLNPGADYLDVYFYSEGVLLSHQQAGDRRAHNQWSQAWFRVPTFELPKTERLEIFLRLDSTQKSLPMELWTMTDYVRQQATKELPMQLYFGALIALLLYNFIMALSTRIVAYFTYSATLLGILLFQIHITGLGAFLLWPSLGRISEFVPIFGALLTYCSSIVFASQLLNLRLPTYLLRLVLIYFTVIFFIYFGCYLLYVEKYVERIAFFLSFPVWLTFMPALAFIGYRQRSPMLKWFLFAWASLLLGALIFMLMLVGKLPVNLLTSSALLIGSAIEFVLFSLALAMRINLLQEQARAEQEVRIKTELRHVEILGLESQHRKRQASSFAHYINNPLNQLVLNRDLLKASSSQTHTLIQSLLPDDSADHEVQSIKGKFQALFSDVNLSLTELDVAVSRITRSIAEVRSVSGIDGAKIQAVNVHKFVGALKSQLADMLAAKDFERVKFVLEKLPEDFSLNADFFLLKNGLEQFLLSLVLKLQEALVISFLEGPDGSLMMIENVGIVGKGEIELFTEALFVSLQNNLEPAGIEAALAKDGPFISLILSSQVR